MAESSVYLELIDGYTANLKSIQHANTGFSNAIKKLSIEAKNLDLVLQRQTESLSKSKGALDQAKKAADEAKKAHDKLKTDASQIDLDKANHAYEQAKQHVNQWGNACKDTEKQLRSLAEQARRLYNVPGGRLGSGGDDSGGLEKMFLSMQKSNLINPVLQSGLNAFVGSLGGNAAGDYFSSALSSALTGASIAGPWGALGGAVVGVASAAIKQFEKRDEYFKSSVKEDYEDVLKYREEQITGGSGIRGSRETLLLSYKTLMGGDQDAANELYDSLLTYANETPYTLGQLSDAGRTLLAYGYEGEQIKGLIGSIGSAAAATGSGAEGLSTMATVIGRLNAGDINARLFQQLNALGMNSFQTLAEEYNAQNGTSITGTEMRKLVSGGKITGQWAAEALLSQWGNNWGSAMTEFSKTFEGLQSTLAGLRENRQDAVGIQYNDKRKSGVEEEIKYLNDTDGRVITAIEGFYGSVQAAAENTQERYQREAEKILLHGGSFGEFGDEINANLQDAHEKYVQYTKDLKAAKANGNEIDAQKAQIAIYNLLDGVRETAEAAYSKSDLFGAIQEGQLDLIDKLQDATLQSWYTYGYQIAEALSKGAWSAAIHYRPGNPQKGTVPESVRGIIGDYNEYGQPFMFYDDTAAYGLRSVPYNGYIAELHQGERVLTAAEARAQDEGTTGGSITVNIGDVTVRDPADADLLAEVIVERILEARKTFVR